MGRAAAGRRHVGGRPARAARLGAEVSPLYDPGLQPERTRLALAPHAAHPGHRQPGRAALPSRNRRRVVAEDRASDVGGCCGGSQTLHERQMRIALVVSPGPLPGGALLFGLAIVTMVVAVFALLGVAVGR